MWPYLVTFFISAIITKQAEKTINRGEKRKFNIVFFRHFVARIISWSAR